MNKYSDLKQRGTVSTFKSLPILPLKTISPESLNHSVKSLKSQSKDSSRISKFSVIENNRTQEITNKIFSSPGSSVASPRFEDTSFPDFRGLVEKLNKISEGPDISKVKTLKDGVIHANELKEDFFTYFLIPCKGKKSPLCIYFKKNFGNFKCFLSKTVEKPDFSRFDVSFSSDFYEISEKTSWFQRDFYYLSVFAVEDTQFSIFTTFGKSHLPADDLFSSKRLQNELESLKDVDFRSDLEKRVENIIKKRKQQALQLGKNKNFVTLNKSPTASHSKDPNWQEKQKNAIFKKNLLIQEKACKTRDLLNRKLKKIEKVKHEIASNRIKEKVETCQKSFLILTTFAKSLESIRALISSKKEKRFNALKAKFAARTLQHYFQFKINHLGPIQISLLNGRNSLFLAHANLFPVEKKKAGKVFVGFLRMNYLNCKAKKSFDLFFKRLLLVQTQVKKFLKKNRNRFLGIVKIWNQVLSKVIMEHAKAKNNPYTKISSKYRDPVIKKYLAQCNQFHAKKVKVYLAAYSIGANYRTSFRMSKSALFPKFNYFPSEIEIRELIEEALNSVGNN
jgi:hypothetical protein